MRYFAAVLTLMALSQGAFAFQSGDKFKCFDDVSGETSVLKILDMGDEDAYVQFTGPQGKRFYPHARVDFDVNSDGARFLLLDDGGLVVEEILLEDAVDEFGRGHGYYADRGDSRTLDCIKLR